MGAFHPGSEDGVPGLEGVPPGTITLVLAGNAGPAMWRAFDDASRQTDDPNPLDNWSRRTLSTLAAKLCGDSGLDIQVLFPFDGPPYFSFQKWAQKSSDVHPSPYGPMVHGQYGLWHAYRGALVIPAKLDLPPLNPSPSPCEDCADKPCLSTCPVSAFGAGTYDVPACIGHLASGRGDECFRRGCLARAACPVGTEYAYGEAQARFHLGKFFANHS